MLNGRERLRPAGPEAIEGEVRRFPGLHVYEDAVVFLYRASAFPIQIGRVALCDLNVHSAVKNRILFGAAAAQQQVPHTMPYNLDTSRITGAAACGSLVGLAASASNGNAIVSAVWFLLLGGLLAADGKLSLRVTTAFWAVRGAQGRAF